MKIVPGAVVKCLVGKYRGCEVVVIGRNMQYRDMITCEVVNNSFKSVINMLPEELKPIKQDEVIFN